MRKSLQNLEEELEMFPETIMITVQRKDLEEAVHELKWQSEEWSNQSCLGYVIRGLEDAGLAGEDVEHLVGFRLGARSMKPHSNRHKTSNVNQDTEKLIGHVV